MTANAPKTAVINGFAASRATASCNGFSCCGPYGWRKALADKMRHASASNRPRPVSPRYDVTREGIAALFKKTGAATIIHGHTHRPARHREAGGTRWVLPDWDLDHGARRGGYLRIDAEGIKPLPLD